MPRLKLDDNFSRSVSLSFFVSLFLCLSLRSCYVWRPCRAWRWVWRARGPRGTPGAPGRTAGQWKHSATSIVLHFFVRVKPKLKMWLCNRRQNLSLFYHFVWNLTTSIDIRSKRDIRRYLFLHSRILTFAQNIQFSYMIQKPWRKQLF